MGGLDRVGGVKRVIQFFGGVLGKLEGWLGWAPHSMSNSGGKSAKEHKERGGGSAPTNGRKGVWSTAGGGGYVDNLGRQHGDEDEVSQPQGLCHVGRLMLNLLRRRIYHTAEMHGALRIERTDLIIVF